MRTLIVFHLGTVGGPHRSLAPVARWLAARGELHVIVPTPGITADEYGRIGEVSVRRYEALTYAREPAKLARLVRRSVREVRMFRREIRSRQPDVVVAVTTVLPALLVAARLERVPAVVFAAEIFDQGWKRAWLLPLWGRLLARMTWELSAGIVCCSQAVARQFPADGRRPLGVAYPPVGDEYASGDRERGRARFGLDGTGPCVVVVGNVGAGRGQDVAIRALAELRRTHPRARLLMVGAPHARAADLDFAAGLSSLADRVGVRDAVLLRDATDDVADVYAAGDVVVNPARVAEAFGRVAPEALVAGRPVVATRVGAIPEVVRDGVDGLLVPPDDPGALAGAIARVVDDPALAARLVASGRERVRERFGPEQDLAAWRFVVEAALSTRRAG